MAFEENRNLYLPEAVFGLPEVDKFGFEKHECHVSCETEICN